LVGPVFYPSISTHRKAISDNALLKKGRKSYIL
jgi:hypothetical protein